MVCLGRAIISFSSSGITRLIPLNSEVDIVQYDQIQAAVAIIVDERCARAPSRIVYARFLGYIRKGPVAVVVIKNIGAKIRHVDIGIAVVVVIANRYAHAVPDVTDAGTFRDINKLEFPRFH